MEKKYELFFGRLGTDPELAYTPKSKPVCNLSVGVNGRDGGKAQWKKVVVWGRLAEKCSVMLKKGSSLFVQGQSSLTVVPGIDGEEKKFKEITAWDVGFTDI
jgi:single-strand DNA-binding protein